MKLLKLTLENFKGVQKFELDLNGNNAIIRGDNATGKTSVFDGLIWLLFGRDSLNRTDFGIKTLDANGAVIHHLDHSVEGVIEHEGVTITLKRIYKEKWSKKRGSAIEKLESHTTDYYVDGVPKSKAEYELLIQSLIDGDIFKLITNPIYFNEMLPWQERRNILFEMVDVVSDEDIIKTNHSLERLIGVISERTIDDHKAVIASRKKNIKKALESIPSRIDENYKIVSEIDGIDDSDLTKELETQAEEMSKLRNRIQMVETTGVNPDAMARLEISRSKLDEYLRNFKDPASTRRSILLQEIDEYEDKKRALRIKADEISDSVKATNKYIADLDKEVEDLKTQFYALNTKVFEGGNCPCCGQKLPAGDIEEKRSAFNLHIAEEKAKINTEGKAAQAHKERLLRDLKELERMLEVTRQEILNVEELIKSRNDSLAGLPSKTNPEDTEEYKELLDTISRAEEEVKKSSESHSSMVAYMKDDLSEMEKKWALLNKKQAEQGLVLETKKRIQELEAEHKLLAEELEEIELDEFAIDEFIKVKVNVMSDKINSKFNMAKFILFENQMNGGIKEVCEVTYNNIPYKSLNNAARINIGIDIINAMTQHFKVSAPVFIDNAEAVTKLLECDSQMIQLVVDESCDRLQVTMN